MLSNVVTSYSHKPLARGWAQEQILQGIVFSFTVSLIIITLIFFYYINDKIERERNDLGVNADSHGSGVKWSKGNPNILSVFPGNGIARRKVLRPVRESALLIAFNVTAEYDFIIF